MRTGLSACRAFLAASGSVAAAVSSTGASSAAAAGPALRASGKTSPLATKTVRAPAGNAVVAMFAAVAYLSVPETRVAEASSHRPVSVLDDETCPQRERIENR